MDAKILIAFVFTMFAISTAPAKGLLDGLSAEQKKEIDDGQLVVVSRDSPGGVWPELTVYTRVDAPVSAVKAVFLDYNNAQNYIPNLVSAKVIGEPEPNVKDIEYTSRMPLLGNSTYTVRNWYDFSGDSVTVRWKLLQSPNAEISDGSMRVEPFGSGSILRYTNYVKPKSSLAVVARGAALSEVKKTVTAIKDESERRARN